MRSFPLQSAFLPRNSDHTGKSQSQRSQLMTLSSFTLSFSRDRVEPGTFLLPQLLLKCVSLRWGEDIITLYWERHSRAHGLLTPTRPHRIGLRPGPLHHQETGAHTACAGLTTLCGNLSPDFMLNECSLVMFKLVINGLSFQYCRLHREGVRVHLLQHERGARRPITLLQLPRHLLAMLAVRERCTLVELILLCLFPLYVSKSFVPSRAAVFCVFPGNLDTKKQWAEMLGLLLLVAGIVMVFAIFHGVGVPPCHWELVHRVLLDICSTQCQRLMRRWLTLDSSTNSREEPLSSMQLTEGNCHEVCFDWGFSK